MPGGGIMPARSLRTTFSHSSGSSPTAARSWPSSERFAVRVRSLWQERQYRWTSSRCAAGAADASPSCPCGAAAPAMPGTAITTTRPTTTSRCSIADSRPGVPAVRDGRGRDAPGARILRTLAVDNFRQLCGNDRINASPSQEPVVRVPAAFDRRCIPPRAVQPAVACVAPRTASVRGCPCPPCALVAPCHARAFFSPLAHSPVSVQRGVPPRLLAPARRVCASRAKVVEDRQGNR